MLVASTRFAILARAEATTLGAPWLPVVTVEHPIGGEPEDAIRDRAENVWREVMNALFTTEEGGN